MTHLINDILAISQYDTASKTVYDLMKAGLIPLEEYCALDREITLEKEAVIRAVRAGAQNLIKQE